MLIYKTVSCLNLHFLEADLSVWIAFKLLENRLCCDIHVGVHEISWKFVWNYWHLLVLQNVSYYCELADKDFILSKQQMEVSLLAIILIISILQIFSWE